MWSEVGLLKAVIVVLGCNVYMCVCVCNNLRRHEICSRLRLLSRMHQTAVHSITSQVESICTHTVFLCCFLSKYQQHQPALYCSSQQLTLHCHSTTIWEWNFLQILFCYIVLYLGQELPWGTVVVVYIGTAVMYCILLTTGGWPKLNNQFTLQIIFFMKMLSIILGSSNHDLC